MSLPPRALSSVAAQSLSLVFLVTLAACGGESDTLFSPSGVAGVEAAGTSSAGSSGGSSAGAGASTGTAGAAVRPVASAQGDVVTHSVCDGKLSQPQALIADFEHGVLGWSSYIGNDGNTVFGNVQSTQPGAAGTQFAALFDGGKAETSGMFRTSYCSDVSKFDGISFWAKGQGGDRVRFLAVIPATDPTSGFGDCDSQTSVCSDHPGAAVILSNQWQAYHVAWRELAQYGWGSPATFAGVINAVLWINDGPVEKFQFAIDQVTLYAGEPPP
jgi:hypothetical protein